MNYLIKMKAELASTKGARLSSNQNLLECALTLSRVKGGGDEYIVVSCHKMVESHLLMPLVLIASRIKKDHAGLIDFYQICQKKPDIAIFDGRFVPADGTINLTHTKGNVLLEGTVNGLMEVINSAVPNRQVSAQNLASIQLKAEKVPWDYEIFQTH